MSYKSSDNGLPIGIMNNESIIRLRHIYTELDKLVLFSIIFIIN